MITRVIMFFIFWRCKYYEDFDRVERIYFGEEVVDEKEKIKIMIYYKSSII